MSYYKCQYKIGTLYQFTKSLYLPELSDLQKVHRVEKNDVAMCIGFKPILEGKFWRVEFLCLKIFQRFTMLKLKTTSIDNEAKLF